MAAKGGSMAYSKWRRQNSSNLAIAASMAAARRLMRISYLYA